MLPVLPAIIWGPNDLHKTCKFVLDSGAAISLLRSETALNLGLIGRDICMNVPKVGEEEGKINTKVYKVPVTAIENQKKALSESD